MSRLVLVILPDAGDNSPTRDALLAALDEDREMLDWTGLDLSVPARIGQVGPSEFRVEHGPHRRITLAATLNVPEAHVEP